MDIIVSQDTRKKKQDGTFPILLRIVNGKETLPISTGYSVPEKYWDNTYREIKRGYVGYDSIKRVNNHISDLRTIGRDVITDLERKGTLYSLTTLEVKARIVSKIREPHAKAAILKLRSDGTIGSDQKREEIMDHLSEIAGNGELAKIPIRNYKKHLTDRISNGSVFEFLDELEADLRTGRKIGYADVHLDLKNALEKFLGHKNLNFTQINLEFLQKMETWHLKKKKVRGVNGLGTYLRTLRSTFNKAVKKGIADKYASPFAEYQIKKEETAKRSISESYLSAIINLKLAETDPLFHARNYFLASFSMWGMSFIDLAFLKKESWVEDRVRYKRSKTSRIYNVQVTEMLKVILEYYAKGKKKDEFIFSIIKRKNYQERYVDMETARTRYNRELKELAERCKITENLTSYVTRHSFATRAKLLKIPVTAIQQMLGHSSIKTTEIYLDSLPDSTIDDYAGNVLDFSPKQKEQSTS